jgi:hypothetical protein
LSEFFGVVVGDCPRAEVLNKVTDVNANMTVSLMNARCTNMLTPHEKSTAKLDGALAAAPWTHFAGMQIVLAPSQRVTCQN